MGGGGASNNAAQQANVGGIVGSSAGILSDCIHSGSVVGERGVGGVAGSFGGTALRCKSTGTVSGELFVGGFAGANGGKILASFSDCRVVGRKDVGGFLGFASGSDMRVENCYSNGMVNGHEWVGGFVGFCVAEGMINNCYSTCLIHPGSIGEGECTPGDIVRGRGSGEPGYLFSRGVIGGLVGNRPGDITVVSACFWDTDINGIVRSDGGTGLSTPEIQSLTTYLAAGWDFAGESDNGSEDLWVMAKDGFTYPRLAWE